MSSFISAITLVVRDYDEAIHYYTQQLGFDLIEDTDLGHGKRWVLVAPPGAQECRLLLARATTAEQQAHIGNQTGGRVMLFLTTDTFWEQYHVMKQRGVTFLESPRAEIYGMVVVFEDLYGNRWDLLERR